MGLPEIVLGFFGRRSLRRKAVGIFRGSDKSKRYNMSAQEIGKAAGEKWKSLSDVEKTPYVAKANELKADYETKLIAYNKEVADGNGDEVASVEDDDDEEARRKPKRPPNPFFVFMEEFREKYKEKYPNEKKVSVIGKAGGAKWKLLSDADKAPYVTKVNELKAEYERKMIAYNDEVTEGNGDEERSDENGNAVDDD